MPESRVRVKICGITRRRDLEVAIDAGADAVGFIVGFPYSPRNMTLDNAEELMAQVPPFVDSVLVTRVGVVERNAERIKNNAPDALQLYGRVARLRRTLDGLGIRVIIPVALKSNLTKVTENFQEADAILTDSFKEGRHGGTGLVSDWNLCARIREQVSPVPLILSGGLNPENIVEAIRAVGPYAVDASSGVESSPGVKDPKKVREFVKRAKEWSS